MAERLTDAERQLKHEYETLLEHGHWIEGNPVAVLGVFSELELLRKENARLRQGLELARNSVVIIMAREGCSLEIDRDAKLSALKEIDDALEEAGKDE